MSEEVHWICQNHGHFQGYYYFHYLGMDRESREPFAPREDFRNTVLSYQTWRDVFGSDPDILGKSINVGSGPLTVTTQGRYTSSGLLDVVSPRRGPDDPLGTVLGPLTMGQTLSLAMVLVGLFLLVRSWRQGTRPAQTAL